MQMVLRENAAGNLSSSEPGKGVHPTVLTLRCVFPFALLQQGLRCATCSRSFKDLLQAPSFCSREDNKSGETLILGHRLNALPC